MSDRWFRLYESVVNDPKVQRLPGEQFRQAFFAAIEGKPSVFSEYIRIDRARSIGSAAWSALRAMVFERDDYTCCYCGRRGLRLECDHIIPVSRGGVDRIENLATACFPCNRSKGAKLIEEWNP